MKSIIEFSLNQRYLVLVLGGLMAALGFWAFLHLPFDAFPDTTPVLVQINVSAPGWAPEEVEKQITFPTEQVLSGLSGLLEVRSLSKYGISQVTLIFEDGTDLYLARQQTSERLLGISLPEGIEPPQLGPVSTGLGEVFHYIVVGKTADPSDVRTAQDWIIKPQLHSVPGVAEINSWGGFVKQYHVVVDPNKLAHLNLSLERIVQALRESVGNVPGGEMVRAGEQTLVRGIGTVVSRDEIEGLVVDTRSGTPIRIRDVGDVVIGHEIRRGATTYNGRGEAVLGLGFMLTGQNPKDVTERLSKRLDELKSSLPDGIEAKAVYKRTELVNKVLRTVEHNLLFGAVLVVAILMIFLGSIRASLIVASAIPLSMLFAFDVMSRVGVIGSLMSLGAIDFGLAVDNAVIQVENSVRRLGEPGQTKSRMEVIREAILEVRKPTLFGELIIIIVYLPILALQGIEGKLFRPMALTVALVLTGSLLLSFTVIPALIATFLKADGRRREPRPLAWLKRVYRPVLSGALRHARLVIAGSFVLVAAGLLVFTSLGSEFVPRLSEGTIAVNCVRLAGASLEQGVDISTRIEKILLDAFPDEIDEIWTRTGTAELATDPMGLELSDIFITLTPRDRWKKAQNQQELATAIDNELSDIPGMNRIFTQPIEMRVNEMIAGIRSDVGIKVFGDDLDVLQERAEAIAALVQTVPGSADVSVEQLTGQPELEVSLDRFELSRYGISPREALTTIESLGGITVGDVYDGQRRFDLAVRLAPPYGNAPEDFARIPLRAENGALVTIDRVTAPRLSEGVASITREWGKRRVVVLTNVRGRDVGSFVDEIRKRIRTDIKLEPGYFVRYGGQFENLERAQRRLALVVPLALVLILGLLYWTYRSVRDALLIFTGVPLAVLGGVAALAIRGMPFSISAAVGFIALSGIAVLNGLVLVSTVKRMRAEGRPLKEAIEESVQTRLRPVLMTALVAAFGFVPMAVSHEVGAEVQRPLATVVIGGILSSTLLTLIVLPSLYLVFGKKSATEV